MPIHMPKKAGMPYRPSNGTEGMMFMENFCFKCIYYEDHCHIIDLTMIYEVDESYYPAQWIFDEQGYPKCMKFEK